MRFECKALHSKRSNNRSKQHQQQQHSHWMPKNFIRIDRLEEKIEKKKQKKTINNSEIITTKSS